MTKISELPNEVRRFVRCLIRAHCRKNQIYKEANKHGIGIEETEETIESLLDKKQLTIETDDDKDNPVFWIKPKDV